MADISEETIAFNSKLEHLYNNEFEKGRFFSVIFEDEKEVHIRLSPRVVFKIVYIKDKNDIEGFQLLKFNGNNQTSEIKFSKFNMQQLKSFLTFINSIDLQSISERRISLADNSLDVLDEDTKKKIATLLASDDGSEIVVDLLREGLVTNQDIVNTGYRRQELNKFYNMLYEDGIDDYKKEIGKENTKDEIAWQEFFKNNQWIFGYGLDYRFNGILQKEFHSSDTNAGGKDGVISDYLLGDKKFTTFVELKLPYTELFSKDKYRSNVWKLSSKLLSAYSQILEQKASGQLKIETTKELMDDSYKEIKQRSYDSKTILIIGSWKEIENEELGIRRIKEKTFELFRRDSRNIDILTYDELYERANFIVNNK